MTVTAGLALLGAATAALFTAALARRWWRSRRPFLLSWTVALVLFTAGIGALAYGSQLGFSQPVFRAYYLCGGLLAGLWLGLGEVELLASAGTGRWARAATLGFSLPAGLVVAFEPLRGQVHGLGVPDGAVLFGPLPRTLVALANIAGTVLVLGGIVVSARRSRIGRPARARLVGTLLIGAGVLLAAGAGAGAALGLPGLQPVVLAAAVAVMYAGFTRTVRRVARHAPVPPSREDRRTARALRLVPPVAVDPLPDTVLGASRWTRAEPRALQDSVR
ncbi:MAG: hypothetical protein NVSMB13_11410 [Mycobacteriales bacterium]